MERSDTRKPAVAGQFYPATAAELNKQLAHFIDRNADKRDALGCILPHAGYIYSGAVAGATIARVAVREKVILIGPNHTGYGTPFSLMSRGVWKTPLGEVAIDTDLADNLLGASQYLQDDESAHSGEHSLEVELPFLQFCRKDFQIVPIAVASPDLAQLKSVGTAIGSTIKSMGIGPAVLLVASSDMTHYEPQEEARKKDTLALEAVLELNEDKLMQRIRQFDISMCGFAPTIVMLAAAKVLGARHAELVKYQTSGDVTSDYSSVVGYAGVIIY